LRRTHHKLSWAPRRREQGRTPPSHNARNGNYFRGFEMTDITAGETNDVPISTGINGTSFAQNILTSYVFAAWTPITAINGIEAAGGPGGPDPQDVDVVSGGTGVIGIGGDAGQANLFIKGRQIGPPGPGLFGRGGSGAAYDVNGGAGVVGQGGAGGAAGVLGSGTGSFDGVAGYGDPNGNGTGVYGQGGPGGTGVRGIGGGSPNTSPPGPVGVYGLGGLESPGVVGQAGGVFGNGVEGYGTGESSGVAGFGDPDSHGAGVAGVGRGSGAPGVRGIGAGGPQTGPAVPAGIYGLGGPQNPGVVGQAGSGPAEGVRGLGAGAGSGVAGYGDPGSNGTGVFGQGQGPGAVGVRGIGSGGPDVFPSSPVGVYGQGGAGGAAGVWGAGGIGVLAQGSDTGVVGEGATVGVRGQGHTGVVAASSGQPGSIGLFASGNAANEMAGEFLGTVFILGDLIVSGLKSAVVPLADGTHRRLYCVESPESWFEDVGFGALVNGRAEISLDPGFAATVQTGQYHVFLSEYDGSNGLYVTARSATGFEVRAGGAVDASFSYRVMAKRKDIEGARLQEVELPTPPQT